MPRECLVVGTGPAALIAGDVLSAAGIRPAFYERKPGPGWKLLVAGASGLNVCHDTPAEKFHEAYGARREELARCFKAFGPLEWLEHLRGLGEDPYVGTSRRYFVKNWKASALLEAWTKRLLDRGAEFHYGEELESLARRADGSIEAGFRSGKAAVSDAVLLALGGASWENELPSWTKALAAHGIACAPFAPANTGYHLDAPPAFFAEAEGKAIKGLILTTAKGAKQGELMITKYGLEGTPVYTMGATGPATLDLKPELPEARLLARISVATGTIERRITAIAKLSEGALLLVKYLAPKAAFGSPESAARLLKAFPIELGAPRPLAEAISSSGGLYWDELGENMELKKLPGVFCAGEMIDWDAPTGGFLLTAAASTGYAAAAGILGY